jgi:hypothetical protein
MLSPSATYSTISQTAPGKRSVVASNPHGAAATRETARNALSKYRSTGDHRCDSSNIYSPRRSSPWQRVVRVSQRHERSNRTRGGRSLTRLSAYPLSPSRGSATHGSLCAMRAVPSKAYSRREIWFPEILLFFQGVLRYNDRRNRRSNAESARDCRHRDDGETA